VTVERRDVSPQPAQIENGGDLPQQMIMWNAFLEIELIGRSCRPTAGPIIAIPDLDDPWLTNLAVTLLQPSSPTASATSGRPTPGARQLLADERDQVLALDEGAAAPFPCDFRPR
jgi:hypothetical protein